MALDKALKNLKYDTRMLEYNLNNGLLSKDELKKYLETLQDSNSNAEQINLEEKSESSHH